MKKILVIGYGNPLRGDDGFGWAVAEQLQEKLSSIQNLHILTPVQLTPELAQTLSDFDIVLFIDAAIGTEPGKLSLMEIDESEIEASFTHQLDPQMLLTTARILFGARPKGFILTVEGLQFELGQGLSDQIREILPTVLQLLEKLISQISESGSDATMIETGKLGVASYA